MIKRGTFLLLVEDTTTARLFESTVAQIPLLKRQESISTISNEIYVNITCCEIKQSKRAPISAVSVLMISCYLTDSYRVLHFTNHADIRTLQVPLLRIARTVSIYSVSSSRSVCNYSLKACRVPDTLLLRTPPRQPPGASPRGADQRRRRTTSVRAALTTGKPRHRERCDWIPRGTRGGRETRSLTAGRPTDGPASWLSRSRFSIRLAFTTL